MKKGMLTFVLALVVILPLAATTSLEEFLEEIRANKVRELKGESIYERILEVMIEQPLDHRNPEKGSFSQRLYISHVDKERPMVMITAGYDAKYYYTSELSLELKSNQIMVEHRYFGKSRPDSIDWSYLDTWQAASDHHRVVELFKEYYPEEWIATGISKGGQTVMYHSYYYPEDVDVRVPYVAPLNFSLEDERIYNHLDQVGSGKARRKVRRFQRMALKKQEKYLPVFIEFSREKGYTYDIAGGFKKAYEYCVLEYSFAFWQWGYVPAQKIPGSGTSPQEVVEHMNRVAGFDYFADEFIVEYRPFFFQALSEMGYYGYDLDRFSKYLRHVENPIFTFTMPGEIEISYNPDLSRDIQDYLMEEGNQFIYIYGEYDTWSATGVMDTGETNSKIFVKEGGSHRTRINNMPAEQREEVYATLKEFLTH